MSEDLFDGIKTEGELAFPHEQEKPFEQEEAPAESSPEEASEEEESPSQEGDTEVTPDTSEEAEDNTPEEEEVPFHKNPRWKKIIADRDAAREEREALKKQVDDMKSSLEKQNQPIGPLPQAFIDQYGNDPVLYKQLLEEEEQQRQQFAAKIKDDLKAEMRAEQEQKTQKEMKQKQWVEDQLEVVAESSGLDLSFKDGKNSLRNEIMQTALKYSPTDENGNIDLVKAYEIYTLQSAQKDKAKIEKKKKVAARATTDEAATETPKRDFRTSADFRNRSWDEVAQQSW